MRPDDCAQDRLARPEHYYYRQKTHARKAEKARPQKTP